MRNSWRQTGNVAPLQFQLGWFDTTKTGALESLHGAPVFLEGAMAPSTSLQPPQPIQPAPGTGELIPLGKTASSCAVDYNQNESGRNAAHIFRA